MWTNGVEHSKKKKTTAKKFHALAQMASPKRAVEMTPCRTNTQPSAAMSRRETYVSKMKWPVAMARTYEEAKPACVNGASCSAARGAGGRGGGDRGAMLRGPGRAGRAAAHPVLPVQDRHEADGQQREVVRGRDQAGDHARPENASFLRRHVRVVALYEAATRRADGPCEGRIRDAVGLSGCHEWADA